jgi:hypothetical protein
LKWKQGLKLAEGRLYIAMLVPHWRHFYWRSLPLQSPFSTLHPHLCRLQPVCFAVPDSGDYY